MKARELAVAVGLTLTVFLAAEVGDAWARAGSGGSRGSRSYSAPARPAPSSPANPQSPSRSLNQPQSAPTAARPSFFGGGLMGGLAGFALGGLLGGLLFGGLGHGLGGFGGIGMMDILLIGGGLFLLYTFLKRRRVEQPQPAYAYGGGGSAPAGNTSGAGSAATVEMPAGESDLDRGLGHIRQMDPAFDPAAVVTLARGIFLDVQRAIEQRDAKALGERLTSRMYTTLQEQCDRLRAARQTNRMEQIDLRRVEPTEAWQEGGQDFLTIYVAAAMVDYIVDDASGGLVDGSKTPQTVEEYWTFTRPVGPNPWRLSAIQTS